MNYYQMRHARRTLVFLAGAFLGLVVGTILTGGFCALTAPTSAEAKPAWASPLKFVVQDGGRYFLMNDTNRDYRPTGGAIVIMERQKHGLVPSCAVVAFPVFIPAGETVGIEIETDGPAKLVIFDADRRYKVELFK